MKRMLVIVFCILFLVGCSDKENLPEEDEQVSTIHLPTVPNTDLTDLVDESSVSEFDYARMVKEESQTLLNVFQRFKTISETKDYTKDWNDKLNIVLDEIEAIGTNMMLINAPAKYREMDTHLKLSGEYLITGAYYYREGLARLDSDIMDEGILKMVEGGGELSEFNRLFVGSINRNVTQDLINEQVLNSIFALSQISYEQKAADLSQSLNCYVREMIDLTYQPAALNSQEAIKITNNALLLVESIELLVPYHESLEIDIILKKGARDIRLGTNYFIDTSKSDNSNFERAQQYLEKGSDTLLQALQYFNVSTGIGMSIEQNVDSLQEYKNNLTIALQNVLQELDALNLSLREGNEDQLKNNISQVHLSLSVALDINPIENDEGIHNLLTECVEHYRSAIDLLEESFENTDINADQINEQFESAKALFENLLRIII